MSKAPAIRRSRGFFIHPRISRALLLFAFSAVIFPVPNIRAEPSALEKSEGAIGGRMGNYRLVDQDGRYVSMNRYRGRPLLLNFMYIDCPDTCALIIDGMRELRRAMDPALSKEMMFLSVSVDLKNDTPERLREFGRAFTDNFTNWKFARTDEDTLAMMVRDMGFTYRKSGSGFEHLNRITLIGPEGRIARHYYGTEYKVEEIEGDARSLLQGRGIREKVSDTLAGILIYCHVYDAGTRTYRLDYGFLAISLLNTLLVAATLFYLAGKKIAAIHRRAAKSAEKKIKAIFS